MRGCAIAHWKNWSISRGAITCHCGRAIGASPSAPQSWSGYTHAHQFKRARRALKFLRIRLGRVLRDIRRKIAGNAALEERFASVLALAVRVRLQDHRLRGPKSLPSGTDPRVYALHAPEVECIGKGKARAPY
jgi:IS5 family transposase